MEKAYVSLLVELFHSSLHSENLTEDQLQESSEKWPEKEASIMAILRKPVATHVDPEDAHVSHA